MKFVSITKNKKNTQQHLENHFSPKWWENVFTNLRENVHVWGEGGKYLAWKKMLSNTKKHGKNHIKQGLSV